MHLSDQIEKFIKDLMSEADYELEVRRNELATYFGCAPSQISYVLATRFSPEHGYVTQSRRGGSGYIKIIRILPGCDRNRLLDRMLGEIGDRISQSRARAMVGSLAERRLISQGEAGVMTSAISDGAMNLPIGAKDMLRACVLKSMFTHLLSRQEGVQ